VRFRTLAQMVLPPSRSLRNMDKNNFHLRQPNPTHRRTNTCTETIVSRSLQVWLAV
jgi:hypothetical protein